MLKKYPKKLTELEGTFRELGVKISKQGLRRDQIANLPVIREITQCSEERRRKRKQKLFAYYASFMAIVTVTVVGYSLWDPQGFKEVFSRIWFYFEGLPAHVERCTLEMPSAVQSFFMPPVDCRICKDRQNVERIAKITPKEFEEKFAYSGVPVIISDGARNWTAIETFSFDFFKNVYMADDRKGCNFFPYKTGFKSLTEVFEMSENRAYMKDGSEPWYIGWSNCDATVTDALRKHYNRPYFLPETSESSSTDWIFMGSPGYGAHMHIDKVGLPSWQAQIKGKKKWILEPAVECSFQCTRMEVVVEQGEIIVLDTNIWFHQTLIVGDEMSVTIGSEYD